MMTSSFPRYEGDHFGPWIWTYVVEMARQGLEVHVLAPQVAAHPTSLEIPEGVKVHRFAYWWPRRYQKLVHPPGMLPQLRNNVLRLFQIPFLIWSYVRVARRIIQREGIQVIHAQWVIPSGFAGAILKKLTKRPLVITSQGAEFYLNHRHPFSKFTKWTLGNVDRLLPVSQMMGTRATSYGMDSDRITVVPNAINPIEFHPGIKTSFRTEHRIPITDTVILTVRRLVHEKRVEDVISAFGMLDLDRDQANCWLVIVGDGPERVNLERIASQQDVGHRILF
ncbi:MAG: glycosyltransferase, partial [Bacteroidota bacterium]